ncbi:peptidoglycan-associated lipoprotein Pal [Shewanella sp. NIFS-20-20]|uniref:peptidoglycan-associated lipoprotein Pal n=1 Tax=Shewanella sp. NIFS-20-20 TaxID=2853806 RepID=UPI001C465440|nr:peptidoglycan-associated lipoprotein Pal [Shewanella sp. NIFS-20-20]MBV7314553.1 peptidoglycan-associated lipoprotein Pal [Shewanella sp. NIFS-20-20]
MQLNTLLKAMAVSIPLLTLAACSSTSESELDSSSSTSQAGQETGLTNNGVETGGVAPMLSPEEQQKQKLENLRKEHIIYFDFDRSDIQPQFAEIIQAHGEYLLEHPNVRVLIEGHSDERGTPEYNIALGERRAQATAKYLQSMGVQPSQLTLVSYGEEKPLDLSRTDEGFGKNRRAVLVY